MKNRKEIVFVAAYTVLCACLFYLLPLILYRAMPGDKTDILMVIAFGFIPIGLFLISFVYGLLSNYVLAAVLAAIIASVPIPFLPIMSGNSTVISVKMHSLLLIFAGIFIIVNIGFGFGVLVRILFRRLISILQGKKENT